MKALRRMIDRFCYKNRRFGISRLMLYIVLISAVVFIVNMMDTTSSFIYYFTFEPSLILRGQVWRLITWVFCPISGDIITTGLSLYFYYFIGSTLEREWGSPKFTLYYIFGIFFNVLFGFILRLTLGFTGGLVPSYLNLSMFFAFAALFPNQVIMLFFFIPIKIKWLALLNAGIFLFSIITGILAHRYLSAFLPIIAFFNFFIFCGEDLLSYLRPLRNKRAPQVINFKKASKKARRQEHERTYRHKCAVCGKTDTENPDLDFRYCSRCEGYHCFCVDHINNHEHFK